MKLKLYFTIIFVCVVLLGILFLINKEGFKNDYSDYNTIDRIITPDIEYAYCVAGNITCPNNGSLTQINDKYAGGKTYNFLCSDNTFAECSGSIAYNTGDLEWTTPSAREINFPFSEKYKGFTIPYSYVPVDISGDYMNFYDSKHKFLDNIHKCLMLNSQTETDECYINIQKSKDEIESQKSSNTKCIANYGTNLGDPLCCGQKGVLQQSALEYVCPSSTPNCSNYVCGQTYGTCS